MKTLSVYLIVKNEESVIERCLNSIISVADEIIITDTGSSDRTKEIIKNFQSGKIKLYDFEWCDDFSKARNFSLEKTACDYVLTTDADEVFEKELQEEIIRYKQNNFFGLDQIFLCLTNFDEYGNERSLYYDSRSIMNKLKSPYWINPVHEHLKTMDKNLTFDFIKKGRILHKKHGGATSQYNKYKEIFLKTITNNFVPTNFDASYFYYFNVTMLWDDTPLSKLYLRECFNYDLLKTSYDFRTILLTECRITKSEFWSLFLMNDPFIKHDNNKLSVLFETARICDENDYTKLITFKFFKENRENELFKPYLKDAYKELVNIERNCNFIKDYIETAELLYQLDNSETEIYNKAMLEKMSINDSRVIINSNSCVHSLCYYANRYFNDIYVITNEKEIPSFCHRVSNIKEALKTDVNKKSLVISRENQISTNDFREIYETFKSKNSDFYVS